jgi:long-chain fatty acid transport protein
MKRKALLWIFISASLVVLMSAGSVFAAGFALYEGGARGLALGAGITATADDASAVFYNPAGITQLKGKQTMIGGTFINPQLDVVTGTTSTGMTNNTHFIPHAYFTWQHSDRLYSGYGIFSRFGLETEFPANWAGRYSSYHGKVQSVEFNPNVAYKVTDTFSVAAGLSVMYFNLAHYQKKIPTAAGDVDADLSGDSYGWGLNLAAHYKPVDWFSAGISYRSRVSQHLEGDADFTKPAVGLPASFFNDKSINGGLRLPDEVFAGVNFKALKNLNIGGGVYWTRWSTYDKLQINYDSALYPGGPAQTTSIKDWDDVFRYMIGMEWNVTNNWDLRLSYAYDESPVPDNTIDYLLPDSDRQQFAIGCGWHNGPWLVDLTYMYILFADRDITARAADGISQGKVENGYAHLLGFSLGYKF